MLNITGAEEVYLACGVTDLRKSIDGLAVLVKEGFKLDPFSTGLFVFCNRLRDKLKILKWDHNGFWLYYRRLERGKFLWPSQADSRHMQVSFRQLWWLLDGMSIKQRGGSLGGHCEDNYMRYKSPDFL
jgi:transposase